MPRPRASAKPAGRTARRAGRPRSQRAVEPAAAATNPYDELPYDSLPCAATHPDNLAAIARLVGLRPAAVPSCRVLELGCGTGANLVPMAAALPQASFVGIDLSPVQIELGRREAAGLGLSNLELKVGDVAAPPRRLGLFDFVIAHGVYSWVPPRVQQALLRLIRATLAPNGVAFVSYDALPGDHPRQALRELLQWRVRGVREAGARVELARRFATLLGAHVSDRAPNATALRRLVGQLGGYSDAYVLHDYLAEVHEAVTLTEFARRAAEAGLRYLGDAQPSLMDPSQLDAEALADVTEAAGDQVAFQQGLDCFAQPPFRTSLLCRQGCAQSRRQSLEPLDDLFLTLWAQPAGEEGGQWLFRAAGGVELGTGSALVAAALQRLCESSPRPLAFAELCERAAAAAPAPGRAAAAVREELGINLLSLASSGQLTFGACDRGIGSASAEPVVAFPPARALALRGEWAVSLWHQRVELEPAERKILPLLNGTLPRAALAAATGLDAAELEALLGSLAAKALLSAGRVRGARD